MPPPKPTPSGRPGNRLGAIALLAAALLAALPAPAMAAEDCAELLLSMRERSWASRGWPGPFRVSYRVWHPPEMSEEAARAGLRAIEGLPDHPDRERLERALLEAEAGGWLEPETIWYFGDDRLRYSSSHTTARPGHTSRVDIGVDGEDYWTLGNHSMTLVRARTAPEDLNQRRYVHRMLGSVVGLAAAPGLYAHLDDVRLESCRADGQTWSAVWSRDDGRKHFTVSGVVAPDGELLTTEMRATMVDGQPRDTGGSIELSRHAYDAVFARSVPRLIRRLGDDGRPIRVYEILAIDRADPGEADALVRRPDPGDTDPVRGEVAYRTVTDWRSGSPSVTTWAAGTGWTAPANAPQIQARANTVSVRAVLLAGAGVLLLGAATAWWFLSGR